MPATPTDQFRHYDYDPGKGLGPLDSLAAPPATAVAAKTASDTRAKATGVAVPINAAPPAYAQRDAIRERQETASVLGASPPSSLSAAAPTGTSPTASVALTWVAPSGGSYAPTGYRVEKSIKSGSVYGPWVAGVPATSAGVAVTVTETGLSTGDIRFRVFTVSGNRESSPAGPVTVTIP